MTEQEDFEAALGALEALAVEEGKNLHLKLAEIPLEKFSSNVPCLMVGIVVTGFESPEELTDWEIKLNKMLQLCLPDLIDDIITDLPDAKLKVAAKPLLHRKTKNVFPWKMPDTLNSN